MKRKQCLSLIAGGAVLPLCFVAVLALASCASSKKNTVAIADVDPVEIASVTVQLENFLGTAIDPKPLTVFFAPRTDHAILQYKVTGNTYKVSLTPEARDLVRKAAVQYNADFDARLLNRDMSYRKTERIYGEAKDCHMEWGTSAFTMTGEANPRVVAGYRFEKRNPYFVVVVPVTENLGYKDGRSPMQNSVKQVIYMNKAQALALADALDENKLLASISTSAIPSWSSDTYADDYGQPAVTPQSAEPAAENAALPATDESVPAEEATTAGENAGAPASGTY